MNIIALLIFAIALSADVVSTAALIERGGYEKLLQFLLGKHPSRVKLWAFAVAKFALAYWFLTVAPNWWPLVLLAAAVHVFAAKRNQKLAR